MTKQEISEEMKALLVAIDALLEQHGLEIAAFPMFAAIYKAAQQRVTKVSNSHAILVGCSGPNTFPKTTFIKEMEAWISSFKGQLDGIDSTVPVSKKSLRDFLKKQIRDANFPATVKVWDEIDKKLSKLGAKVTPKQFAEATKQGLDNFSQNFPLSDEYENNKDFYKPIKKKDLDTYIMPTSKLSDGLSDAITKAEAEAKREKKEAKREKKEAKREKKEAKREKEKAEAEAKREKKKAEEKAADKAADFLKTYEKWRNTQEEICAKIISQDQGTDSVHIMSKNKFMAILLQEGNLWAKYQPELTKDLLSLIMKGLKKDKAPIGDYVNAMSNAVSHLRTSKAVIASNWFVDPTMPEFYSLQTALVTENEGYGAADLMEEYLDWFQGIGAVVDSLNTPKSQQFIIEKVLDGIKLRFNGRKELEFLYAPFEKMLNKFKTSKNPKYCSKGELSYAWSESLYRTITNASILNDSLDEVMSLPDKGFVDGISDTLKGLINSDSLERIFLDSRRPVIKPEGLANGENLHTQLFFSDGTDLTNTFLTKIVKVDNVPCVVPTDVSLTIASNRENGYSFGRKDFVAQSPIINGEEGVTVYFEYKVYFERNRGSSTTGSENTTETGLELGAEQSVTDIAINHYAVSNTTGRSVTVGGEVKPPKWLQFLGLDAGLQGEATVSNEFTLGYERETGIEKTTGSSIALSASKSNTTSQSQTTEKGTQAGFFLVTGELYSHNIDKEGGALQVSLYKKASPKKRNGLEVFSPNFKNNKTLRWSK